MAAPTESFCRFIIPNQDLCVACSLVQRDSYFIVRKDWLKGAAYDLVNNFYNITLDISGNAGTYICNACYKALNRIKDARARVEKLASNLLKSSQKFRQLSIKRPLEESPPDNDIKPLDQITDLSLSGKRPRIDSRPDSSPDSSTVQKSLFDHKSSLTTPSTETKPDLTQPSFHQLDYNIIESLEIKRELETTSQTESVTVSVSKPVFLNKTTTPVFQNKKKTPKTVYGSSTPVFLDKKTQQILHGSTQVFLDKKTQQIVHGSKTIPKTIHGSMPVILDGSTPLFLNETTQQIHYPLSPTRLAKQRLKSVLFKSLELSECLMPLIKCLAIGNISKAVRQLFTLERTKSQSLKALSTVISNESKAFTKVNTDFAITKYKMPEIENFEEIQTDFKKASPTLWACVSSAATSRHTKKYDHVKVCAALCIIMNSQSKSLNYLQRAVGLIMRKNKLKKDGYLVLNKLGISIGYNTLKETLNKAKTSNEDKMEEYKEEDLENIDIKEFKEGELYNADIQEELDNADIQEELYNADIQEELYNADIQEELYNADIQEELDNADKEELDNADEEEELDNSDIEVELDIADVEEELDNADVKEELDNSDIEEELDNSDIKEELDNSDIEEELDNADIKEELDNSDIEEFQYTGIENEHSYSETSGLIMDCDTIMDNYIPV